ncbi:MAG TPA: anti-sigma factor [Baekduia sp.]|nr:anti-sigma factor [Baekduia sp.]
MICDRTLDAGSYVLHAMDDDEAAQYAAHVASCPDCTAAVADMQLVADTLPMAAPQLAPPPALKGRIMAVVEAEAQLLRAAGPEADRPPAPSPARRRRLWGLGDALRVRPLAAVGVACALLAAGLVGGAVLTGGGGDAVVRTVQASAPDGATARVELTDDGQAELVFDRMPQAPVGRVYQVWLKREGGDPQPTHTLFTVREDGRARVTVDESVEGIDQLLVTAEPGGGSQRPTRAPVVAADLS